KSKGVLITGLKLKAFRNPQPSWGFSIDKKNSAEAEFRALRENQ
ncbi:ABC transporter ATP-binding protein, partial [Salmonella enterica subsp. enterica]|nr:ABC transporter ATP-binding protein [Salmonella enterica subsp. enterica serovar Orion]EAU1175833.1 ABC transporter ATP-binding protein [Salmonella enterica]EBO1349948.1 ABC transporter ATP-binding protein [Salmonella enterica subsp. enterica]ECF6867936.1 ABC transporter ATP-binding protein [Salmonella enterica subsp. enterica serovar Lexington]MJK07096.1 ABC transporter ATP-binding protein [Salmonella enterica subsp. enterica serovar Binza]